MQFSHEKAISFNISYENENFDFFNNNLKYLNVIFIKIILIFIDSPLWFWLIFNQYPAFLVIECRYFGVLKNIYDAYLIK